MSEHAGKTYRPWEPQRYQHEAHSPASKLPEGDLVFFLLDVLFVFAVGILFGEIVRRGGSILGVTLAHGITNVTLFLVMPYVAQHPTSDLAMSAPWAIWGCTGIALIVGWLSVGNGDICTQVVCDSGGAKLASCE